MAGKQEILTKLSEAVLEFEEDDARNAALEALENNIDVTEAIMEGLTDGMKRAGELFKQQEYFVPELLLCSDAMEEGLKVLRPHLPEISENKSEGQIILGTVEGDIHSIGKNLVKLMLDTNGFQVHDLGEDVALQRFAEEQKRTGAEIIGMSALMTTSMMAVEKAIPMLREAAPGINILVGGAPFTKEIAEKYGADGFAADAVNAVNEAKRLMSLKKD